MIDMPIKNLASKKVPKFKKPSLKVTKSGLGKFLVFVLLIGSMATAGYYYYQYQQSGVNDVEKTIKAVEKLMTLPDELPTVATVTDESQLQDNDFFNKAKNGDKVLIYQGARKAILYRPSANRIVDVAPVRVTDDTANAEETRVLGEEDAQVTGTPEEAEEYSVAVLNGTEVDDAADGIVAEVSSIDGMNVERGNASNRDYDVSQIVVVNEAGQEGAVQLSRALGLDITDQLPDGEDNPGTDIAIIIGADQVPDSGDADESEE